MKILTWYNGGIQIFNIDDWSLPLIINCNKHSSAW
jgi:hypothetical protein